MEVALAVFKRFFFLFLCAACSTAFSATFVTDTVKRVIADTLPVPSTPNLLFYVQRTANINTIVYDLNTGRDRKPDAENPVHVYWIRYAEQGQKAELNYIQRNFAYGLNTKRLKNGDFEISFVSYRKMKMLLQYSEKEKKYAVYAQMGTKRVRVKRVFVKIEGGTFWVPKVSYIEIKGTDTAAGTEIAERFQPQ